jgi:hypothetical protein
MIQPTVTLATVVNQGTTEVSVDSPNTSTVTADNIVTTTVAVSAPELTTHRTTICLCSP